MVLGPGKERVGGIGDSRPILIPRDLPRRLPPALMPGGAHREERTGTGSPLPGERPLFHALRRRVAAAPDVRRDRVEELRSAIRSGSYVVDPRKVAERLLEGDTPHE